MDKELFWIFFALLIFIFFALYFYFALHYDILPLPHYDNGFYGLVGGMIYANQEAVKSAMRIYDDHLIPLDIYSSISLSNDTYGQIMSVGINSKRYGIIGGFKGTSSQSYPYATLISPHGVAKNITLPNIEGTINSVSINENGHCILGGVLDNKGYVAFVDSKTSEVIELVVPSLLQNVFNVSINNADQCLVGGLTGKTPFVFTCKYGDVDSFTEVDLGPVIGNSYAYIYKMSIGTNNIGHGIVGGYYGTPYKYFAGTVDLNTSEYQEVILEGGMEENTAGSSSVTSVYINDLDQCIFGGFWNDSKSNSYVSVVIYGSANGTIVPSFTDTTTIFTPNSVEVCSNNNGYGVTSSYSGSVYILNLSNGDMNQIPAPSPGYGEALISINDSNKIALAVSYFNTSKVFTTTIANPSVLIEVGKTPPDFFANDIAI